MAGLEELPAEPSETNDEFDEVQQVAALMQARITQNWRRPPSARNGMEALLDKPCSNWRSGGHQCVDSSGSSAFDRSAIAAVERVGQFQNWKSCQFLISSDTFVGSHCDSALKI